MPYLKTYLLFVSHTWRYNADYYNLENLLRDVPYFNWKNFSVPVHDPLIRPDTHVGRAKLTRMLENQINPSHCVLILAGMYAHHSDWVRTEMELAQRKNKPLIGIYPWGSINCPRVVSDNVLTMVGWNSNSIVTAIRKYAI